MKLCTQRVFRMFTGNVPSEKICMDFNIFCTKINLPFNSTFCELSEVSLRESSWTIHFLIWFSASEYNLLFRVDCLSGCPFLCFPFVVIHLGAHAMSGMLSKYECAVLYHNLALRIPSSHFFWASPLYVIHPLKWSLPALA